MRIAMLEGDQNLIPWNQVGDRRENDIKDTVGSTSRRRLRRREMDLEGTAVLNSRDTYR
jgi:hypothetical protein